MEYVVRIFGATVRTMPQTPSLLVLQQHAAHCAMLPMFLERCWSVLGAEHVSDSERQCNVPQTHRGCRYHLLWEIQNVDRYTNAPIESNGAWHDSCLQPGMSSGRLHHPMGVVSRQWMRLSHFWNDDGSYSICGLVVSTTYSGNSEFVVNAYVKVQHRFPDPLLLCLVHANFVVQLPVDEDMASEGLIETRRCLLKLVTGCSCASLQKARLEEVFLLYVLCSGRQKTSHS